MILVTHKPQRDEPPINLSLLHKPLHYLPIIKILHLKFESLPSLVFPQPHVLFSPYPFSNPSSLNVAPRTPPPSSSIHNTTNISIANNPTKLPALLPMISAPALLNGTTPAGVVAVVGLVGRTGETEVLEVIVVLLKV